MKRYLVHTLQTAAAALFVLYAGASAALAGPVPVQPDFAPPTPNATIVPADPSFETQLRWMLNGAGVVLAVTGLALVAVLWHRSRTAPGRIATPWGFGDDHHDRVRPARARGPLRRAWLDQSSEKSSPGRTSTMR